MENNKIKISHHYKSMDMIYALTVIIFNPVVITFYFDTQFSFPDTFSYIREAQRILSEFQFNTGAWGHINTSMILPPVYPSMIAILMQFGFDGLHASVIICQISGILFSLIMYFYITQYTSRIIGLIAILTVHITYVYFNLFTLAMTEAPFLLLLSMLFICVTRLDMNKFHYYVVTGVVTGLIFLCREIGVTALFLLFIYYSIIFLQEKYPVSTYISRIFIFVLSFSFLVVPFYVLRYEQTGQLPWSRLYELNKYNIYTDDKNLIRNIEKLKSAKINNYVDEYNKRHYLYRLSEDGKEVLGKIKYRSENNNQVKQQDKNESEIAFFLENLKNNLFNLVQSTGLLIFLVFIFVTIIEFLISRNRRRVERQLVNLFLIIYLITLSGITSQVYRYVYVLIPLILMNNFISFYRIILHLFQSNRIVMILFALILPVTTAYSSPKLFYNKQVYTKNHELEKNLVALRREVKGDAVFTLYPYFAYSVGGVFRQLPNDTLEKITKYAAYTNVKWMLIVDSSQVRDTMQFWPSLNNWINKTGYIKNNPGLEYCCGFYDKTSHSDWRLYMFRGNTH